MTHRITVTEAFAWRDYRLLVSYTPNYWPTLADQDVPGAYLEVKALDPPDGPLPISATGRRHIWTHTDVVAEAGGPVHFAREWLDAAAEWPEWRRAQEESRQLTLL